MDDSHIEETLDKALEEFRGARGKYESGLDVDDPALLQLRKSCRLIEAIEVLKDENGYYTLIIEASFAVIERTIQFYLLEKGLISSDDFIDHKIVYEKGEKAGLYREDFKDKLLELWKNNRSRTYYRGGVGTERSAELMTEMAKEIHDHILQLSGKSHKCIC